MKIAYAHLDALRNKYLENSEEPSRDSNVELDGQQFRQYFWGELLDDGELYIFMLELQKAFSSNAYCIGLLIQPNGLTRKLNNEELWELGIP